MDLGRGWPGSLRGTPVRFVPVTSEPFRLICEIEPPTRPELKHVRHQIGVLTPIAESFLIPDNHIGRATVSSIAVAHEVELMGGHSVACVKARDRNLPASIRMAATMTHGPKRRGKVTGRIRPMILARERDG